MSFNGQTVKATTKGKAWKAVLQPMPANATGQELVAYQKSGSASVKNVVVGEVWIASGQSNMLWRLNQTPAARPPLHSLPTRISVSTTASRRCTPAAPLQ